MTSSVSQVPSLIRELYAVVGKLEAAFPERRFTPDGHLVGSIGEVLAAHRFGLELLAASAETHDAEAPDGRLVQIKATQGSKVALRSCPDHLLVLTIDEQGETSVAYNGPGQPAWERASPMQKNGARPISLYRLRLLASSQPSSAQLPEQPST